jgi:hypothetical protein
MDLRLHKFKITIVPRMSRIPKTRKQLQQHCIVYSECNDDLYQLQAVSKNLRSLSEIQNRISYFFYKHHLLCKYNILSQNLITSTIDLNHAFMPSSGGLAPRATRAMALGAGPISPH